MEVKVDSPVINPLGDLIRDIRKRTEVFLFFLKHFIAASVTFLESFMFELIKLVSDTFPELCKGVIHVVPASGDDSGGDLTDRAFYRRFPAIIGNC